MNNENDIINLFYKRTYEHVKKVNKNINIFIKCLIDRAENHDNSKLYEPELSIYASQVHKTANVIYGSNEYKQLAEEAKIAVRHHHLNNRHHPEHFKNGIDDMNLVDLIEMLSDWKAAVEKNKDGDIEKSLDINSTEYNISPQLKGILKNTIRECFKS